MDPILSRNGPSGKLGTVHVPQPQVSDWETGKYKVISVPNLVKLAKGLECSVDALLVGLDEEYLGGHPNPAISGHLKTGHYG